MKKIGWLPLCFFCLTLCACTKTEPAWEYVRDSLFTQSPEEQTQYCISFDVPADAVLEEGDSNEKRSVYRQKDGDYEIVCQIFDSNDFETAVKTLSGFSPEQLSVLYTTRYGMDECQFVWCSQTEQGMTLSRADAILAGPYCYALTFSAGEDAAAQYTATQQQVFGSFSLFEDEGF